ncbi:flagellar hook-length control protein FliK [Alkalihalobacillus pseudalcaliphilus]|uniref:flagellar hook-length control protein FliK n=1 Tax=Alkalihalobacillus pseudalcaliphilus TaxID=79884 RepID=UPI00064DD019|nr:flagellar hook-length control protein FliK [Alkalihalobacillus pseudalcaliphilus]KMK77220.1 hypothetical protein AB990_06635 [Alkalihalobacillus pseudalcaliphilus]
MTMVQQIHSLVTYTQASSKELTSTNVHFAELLQSSMPVSDQESQTSEELDLEQVLKKLEEFLLASPNNSKEEEIGLGQAHAPDLINELVATDNPSNVLRDGNLTEEALQQITAWFSAYMQTEGQTISTQENPQLVEMIHLISDLANLFPEQLEHLLQSEVESNKDIQETGENQLLVLIQQLVQLDQNQWMQIESQVVKKGQEQQEPDVWQRFMYFVREQVQHAVQKASSHESPSHQSFNLQNNNVTFATPFRNHSGDHQASKAPFMVNNLHGLDQAVTTTTQHGLLEGGNAQGLEAERFNGSMFLSQVEQATIRLGVHQEPAVVQNQFLKQLEQIFQRQLLQNTQLTDTQTIQVRLFPEHLGRLDIQLTVQEGQVIAKILTQTAGARELVESQLPQLRQALAQQQLHLDKVEVSEQREKFEGNQQSKQEKEQPQSQLFFENEEDEADFYEWLETYSFDETI